ncbi:MAG TPA: NAD(P)-dependent oxidoreductase [Kiritimatiellia bacterium]|jgi:D-lactate dehydrogenase
MIVCPMDRPACDVYFYEAFAEEVPELQKHLGPEIRAGFTWKTVQEEAHHTPPAALISIRTQSEIPDAWAKSVRGILARSTGFDHLLAWRSATSSPAALGCLSTYCGRAVAEQAALAWLALLRRLPAQTTQFPSFNRDGLTGVECEHRTLLVVGVGDIGHQVARIGRGLGMHVLGVDLVHRHPDVVYVEVDEALPRADVIVCAMNLTQANTRYFAYDRLRKARPGAVFVNVSRGEFSPCPDLLRLLDEHVLGGVALDVFEHEQALAHALRGGSVPDRAEFTAVLKLRERPNVLLTPHNAFNTVEALSRKAGQSAEQVRHFLKTGGFVWNV